MDNTGGYVNLMYSQCSIDLDSPEPVWLGSQAPEPPVVDSAINSRRKWTPQEDKILIGAWLNTSKDPVVGNEQRAGKFWQRIIEYYNASPQLVGRIPREIIPAKQRWGRINDQVSNRGG
uniref:Myb-like domain-containing protein n=1 Tax=Brassica oleracea TaxID=3712 RepID=A0A3P6CVW0_BRAOL|nr:unnamed protein product [Brassica oleracea]